MYGLATKGVQEVVTPQGGFAIPQRNNQNGFLTAVAAWLPLALTGANIGGVTPSLSCPASPTTTVSIIPIPGCTTLAAQATLTITPDCATAIAALPTVPLNSQNVNCSVSSNLVCRLNIERTRADPIYIGPLRSLENIDWYLLLSGCGRTRQPKFVLEAQPTYGKKNC